MFNNRKKIISLFLALLMVISSASNYTYLVSAESVESAMTEQDVVNAPAESLAEESQQEEEPEPAPVEEPAQEQEETPAPEPEPAPEPIPEPEPVVESVPEPQPEPQSEPQPEVQHEPTQEEQIPVTEAAPVEVPQQDLSAENTETQEEVPAEVTTEPITEVVEVAPKNILTYSNKEDKKEEDRELSITIKKEEDFKENQTAKIEEIKEERLEELVESLSLFMPEKDISALLPIEISIIDENKEEVKFNNEELSIEIDLKDAKDYKDCELYHLEENKEWKKVDFKIKEKVLGDNNETIRDEYIAFKVDNLSPFIFAEIKDKETESETETITEVQIEQQSEAQTEVQTETETDATLDETYIDVLGENPKEEEDLVHIYDGNISQEELLNLPDDMAGVTTTVDSKGSFLKASGSDWTFDDYYIENNAVSGTHVNKNDNFSLKYQMEIHFSRDVEFNKCEIRVPKYLFTNRNGNKQAPTIPVVKGTPSKYTSTLVTPFNYYEDGDTLVFWNYRKIISGTNCTIQILYPEQDALYIIDGTTWSITPVVSVEFTGESPDVKNGVTLTGLVDTSVSISSISKTPLRETGKNYTPGLYTTSQVRSLVSNPSMPGSLSEYVYVAWRVNVFGGGNQSYDLYIKDTPYLNKTIRGFLVGFNRELEYVSTGTYSGYYHLQEDTSRNFTVPDLIVVTAYPKSAIETNVTKVSNDIDVIVHPKDNIDPDTSQSYHAEWVYQDYRWIYQGDTIGIEKYNIDNPLNFSKDFDYDAWMDIYRKKSANGEDLTGPRFSVNGIMRSFNLTHYTTREEIDENTVAYTIGDYRPGAYVTQTTVDDMVIAYPQDGPHAGEALILGQDDYYFNSATLKVVEKGYDIYEDTYSSETETHERIDRTCRFYAMYSGSTEWTRIGSIPYRSDGCYEYELTTDQLSRKPYKLKAEFNTTEYLCNQYMDVQITIKGDSPVFATIKDSKVVRIENLAGIYGWYVSDDEPNGRFIQDVYIHDDNYSEPTVLETTMDWYGMLLMRDAAFGTLTSITKKALSSKSVIAKNDILGGRVNLTYDILSYEGYKAYSKYVIEELEDTGIQTPDRKSVEIYDLLPLNVKFDPSEEVTAGRLAYAEASNIMNPPTTWDRSDVSVYINPDTDVIENWRNTGRTLCIFHISYDGDSTASYDDKNKEWFTGYGLRFGAYVGWQDLKEMANDKNLAAYMPVSTDTNPILGENNEVSCDDGNPTVVDGDPSEYTIYGSDINEDGVTNIRNVLFSKSLSVGDVPIATTSGITKLVKADRDKFSEYTDSTSTGYGEGYTYKITLKNSSQYDMKDIIFFDRIENAAIDRREQEPEMSFEADGWHGFFNGFDLSILDRHNIDYTIYYNEQRNAVIPVNKEDPYTALTNENGWIPSTSYTGDLSNVKAFAIDISKTTDNADFLLSPDSSIYFYVKMRAPSSQQSYEWAYNNPSFYSTTLGLTQEDTVSETVVGNSVKIKLTESETLKVRKQYDGVVPKDIELSVFEFTLKRTSSGKGVSSQIYDLYQKNTETNEYELFEGNKLHATNGQGKFYLKANQQAVFRGIVGMDDMVVEETFNPIWETTITEEKIGTDKTVVFTNKYHPILYVSKQGIGIPRGIDTSSQRFNIKILVNNEPLSNQEVYVVPYVPSNPIVPEVLNTRVTDANGILSFSLGETVCIPIENIEDTWQVIEQDGSYGDNTNWICETPTISGQASTGVNSAIIRNIYKYKRLYVQKRIENQSVSDCNQEFTFKLWQLNENAVISSEADISTYATLVTNKNWWLTTDTETVHEIGSDGLITCACAGTTIVIDGLLGGKTYILEEVDSGQYYKPDQDLYSAIIPLYGESESITVTNIYQLSDLSVTKTLYSENTTDLSTKTFGVKIELYDKTTQDWVPLANTSCKSLIGNTTTTKTTNDEGIVYIKSKETLTFNDVAEIGTEYRISELPDSTYVSLYPKQGEYAEGVFSQGENLCNILNGSGDVLYLAKRYVAADNNTTTRNLLTKLNNYNMNYMTFLLDDIGYYYISGLEYGDQSRAKFNIYAYLEVSEDGETWERISPDSEDYTISLLMSNGTKKNYAEYKPEDYFTQYTWLPGNYSLDKYPIYNDSGIFVIPISAMIAVEKNSGSMQGLKYRLVEVGIRGAYTEQYPLKNVASDDDYRLYYGTESTYVDSISTYGVVVNDKVSSVSVSGEVDKDNVAILENTLSTNTASWKSITKTVKQEGDLEKYPVDGSVLTLRVEKFDGRNWIPASGVSYMTTEGSDKVIQKTGSDGLIQLIAPKKSVSVSRGIGLYTSTQSASVGSLRIVEVLELSDPAFGHYISSKDSEYSGSLTNSTNLQTFVVEKVIDGTSDDLFTFQLGYKDQTGSSAMESSIIQNIPYIVYDSLTKTVVDTGVTNSLGQFSIKGGQYAELSVPIGTWSVRELDPYPWKLENSENSGTDTTMENDIGEVDLFEDYLMGEGSTIGSHIASKLGFSYANAMNVRELYIGSKEEYASEVEGVEGVPIDYYQKGYIKAYYVQGSDGNRMYYLSERAPKVNGNPNSGASYLCYPYSNTIEYADVHGLNTSNVTRVNDLAYYCRKIKKVDGINEWDWSNIEEASYMFNYCENLEEVDLSNINAPKCYNMNYCFRGCDRVTKFDMHDSYFPVCNMSTFTTGLASKSTTPCDIDVSNTTIGCYYYFLEGYSDLQGNFGTVNLTNFTVTGHYFDGFTDMRLEPSNTTYFLAYANIQELIGLDTVANHGQSIEYFFCYVTGLTEVDASGIDFSSNPDVNYSLSSNKRRIANIFSNCPDLVSIDFSGANLEGIESELYSFGSSCPNLEVIDLSDVYAPNLVNINSFCSGSTKVRELYLNDTILTNCKNAYFGFSSLKNLERVEAKNLKTADVCNLFYDCYASHLDVTGLVYVPAESPNSSGHGSTEADFMFNRVHAEEIIGLNTMDLSKCTSIEYILSSTSLKRIDLSGMDFSGVVDNNMTLFYYSPNLETVCLDDVNLCNVPTFYTDGFRYCDSLVSVSAKRLNFSHLQNRTGSTSFFYCDHKIDVDVTDAIISCYLSLFSGTNIGTLTLTGLHRDLTRASNHAAANMLNFSNIDELVDLNTVNMTGITTLVYWIYIPSSSPITSIDISGMNMESVNSIYNVIYTGKSYFEEIKATDLNWASLNSTNGLFIANSKVYDIRNMRFKRSANLSALFNSQSTLDTIYCNDDWSTLVDDQGTNSIFNVSSTCTLVGAIPFDTNKRTIEYANPDTGYFTRKAS